MIRPAPWALALLLPGLLTLPPAAGLPPARWLRDADEQLRGGFFRLRGARPGPADPVVLAIDAASLSVPELVPAAERRESALLRRMGPWPWPRALQAELAAHVLERGARQVVFNIVHATPSGHGPGDDAAFLARLAPWREQVVLAAAYERVIEPGGLERSRLLRPLWPWPRVGLSTLLETSGGRPAAIPGRQWLTRELAAFPGPHPRALAFAAAARPGPAAPLGIDYPGPASVWRTVPAWTLPEQPDGLWRGRTVIIGATAPELGDRQETPFGPMGGTLVQAAALATVMEGRGHRTLPGLGAPLLVLAWALASALLLRRVAGATALLLLALLLPALALAGGLLLWQVQHLWLPVAALAATPLAGGGVRAAAAWRRESRERAYVLQVLARRVSPALLRDILRHPGPLGTRLGGHRTRCVVLFTDLVDFTALSARIPVEDLFDLLNRYFEGLAAAVLAEGGLLDKFIGDALMAEFGVPRSRGAREEALAAVRAALAMQSRLEALNRDLADQGRPPLRQGIGLHVGEVMAGNLGSPQRLEFTVIGAAVNVASRIEALSRRFPGHAILLSGELRELLGGSVRAAFLGHHDLRGWPRPVAVYGLEGLAEGPEGRLVSGEAGASE